MTKGNPKVIVRLSPEMRGEILEAIKRRNARTREEPWDLSAFIRTAIRDKLHHMQRSRCRRNRKTRKTQSTPTSERAGAA